jgi:trimeric autotransporter adhesin
MPRAFLDANTPTGAIAYLLPIFFPELKPSDFKVFRFFAIQDTGSGSDILGKNISVYVPYSTNLESLTSEFYHSGNSLRVNSVEQISGISKNNFSTPVTYTVRAYNNTFRDYMVRLNKGTQASNSLLSFSLTRSLESQSFRGSILGNTVSVYLPFGTDLTRLIPIFSHDGKSVFVNDKEQFSGKGSLDFSSPLALDVFSESGSKQTYLITAIVSSADSKELTALWLDGYRGNISGRDAIVFVPFETNLQNMVLSYTITGSRLLSDRKEILNGDSALDFSNA